MANDIVINALKFRLEVLEIYRTKVNTKLQHLLEAYFIKIIIHIFLISKLNFSVIFYLYISIIKN